VDDFTPAPNHNTSPYQGGLGPEFEAMLLRMDAREEERQAVEAVRGIKALMLAPHIEICRALLRGERIPWNQLDYFQAQRYGLRRRPPGGRVGLDDFWDVRA
jgi:hypothetical protein